MFSRAIINTYAILFFSQSKILGGILLLVSFLNPLAGLSALFCVCFSIWLTQALNYQRDNIQAGIYSFNSLILGLAFGTFYQADGHYIIWLLFSCILVVVITVVLVEKLGRIGLPVLSLPFILTFWLILLGGNNVFNNRLLPKINDVVQVVYGNTANVGNFHNYLSVCFPCYISLFFRSISAVLFQDNIITGIIISVGLLIHSRIAFCLVIIGFLVAVGFNAMTGIYPNGISYYYLGANFMMTTTAVGGFFLVPSWRSYLCAILCVPVLILLTNALSGVLALYNLPVFSMPFCIISTLLLYFLILRKTPGKMQLVSLQHYSPERNLYQFTNQQERLDNLKYFRLNLPFMGAWTVSQGYDGSITHKGEWSNALDFVIEDDDEKSYQLPATLPEHFYCYSKPVLACGDGVVANVIDHIEDNIIGEINLKENWGNTVVIKHLEGLYSKVSHLKKDSIKVEPGDVIKQGDLLGLCGNSGRSPMPHLHFQVQATPYIDAKTIAYPFSYYAIKNGKSAVLKSFEVPGEREVITSIAINKELKAAFNFQPGFTKKLYDDNNRAETIEVFVDEFNQSYIYSKETGAVAYFINDTNEFCFTSFYGDQRSLLYHFYLAAFKITFNDDENVVADDVYPLQLYPNKLKLAIQDVVAPFHRFLSLNYRSRVLKEKVGLIVTANQYVGKKREMEAVISVADNKINEFNININGRHITVQWE